GLTRSTRFGSCPSKRFSQSTLDKQFENSLRQFGNRMIRARAVHGRLTYGPEENCSSHPPASQKCGAPSKRSQGRTVAGDFARHCRRKSTRRITDVLSHAR